MDPYKGQGPEELKRWLDRLINLIANTSYRVVSVVTPVSSSGTTETDLQSLTLPAGLFAADGDTVHVSAGFIHSGSTDDITLRLYVDGVSQVSHIIDNEENGQPGFYADIQMIRTGADELTVYGSMQGSIAGSREPLPFCVVISGLSFSGPVDVKFTGQSAGTTDTLTQHTMFADFTKQL